MATQTLSKQEQFFYENAGYWYDKETETPDQGRTRAAIQLAAAEQWFIESGYQFWTDHDADADWSWMDDEDRNQDHEVVYAVLENESGIVVQSLGGIFDPTPEYLRVVRAELALEEMA